MSDGRVVVDSFFDDGPIQTGLKDLQKSVNKVGDDFVKMGKGLTMKVTAPIIGAFGLAVKGAADLEGATSKFEVVFGDMSDEMMEWVGTYRKEFPLARSEIIKHSAGLQDLLKPMGVNREEAAYMTQDWLDLAGALAAFNDVPIETALEAIRSGIVGSSEPLTQFGIDARVGSLEQVALAEGLIEAGEEMDMQTRQQALLIQAYEQSSDAVNGLEEQKGSLLWQMQELWATTKDLGDEFGKILLPYVKRLVDGVQGLLEKFKALDVDTQRVIVIAGLLLAALGPVLIFVGVLIKAVGFLAGAFSLISAPVLIVIAAIAGIAFAVKHLWDTNEAFREAVLTIWNTIMEHVRYIRDNWRDILVNMGEKIMGFVAIIRDFAEPMIAQFKESINIFISSVRPAWASLVEAFNAIRPILEAIGIVIGAVFATALAVIIGVINGILQGIGFFIAGFGNMLSFISNVVMAVSRLFVGDFAGAFDYLNEAAGNAVDFFINMFKSVLGFIKGFVGGVVSFFKGLYMTLVGNSIIPDMVNGIIEWFFKLPGRAFEAVKNMVSKVLGAITSLPGKMLSMGKDVAMNVGKGVLKMASFAKNRMKDLATGLLDKITGLPGNLLDIGKNIASSLGDGIKNAASGAIKAASDLASGVADKVKGFFKISSPSKLFTGFGEDTGEGFEIGIDNKIKDVEKMALKMAASATPDAIKAGVSSATNNNNSTLNSTLKVDNLTVREEADVEKVARKLYKLQQTRGRSVAGAY